MDSIPILFDPSSQLPRFPQVMEQVQSAPTSYPCVADVGYIQQQFAAGAPPSLVIPATAIPLYPGYAQVPPGPGFTVNPFDSKYTQLLAVIEEMGKDLRPTYSGSKTSAERFKRGIAQARILLRECMTESDQQRNTSSRS